MEQNGKLTVLDPHGQPTGIFGRCLEAQSNPRAILDPFEQPSGELKPMSMAPRLAALNGKTVYLVETGFAGSFELDRKSTRLNSSHLGISYAVFCLKKK